MAFDACNICRGGTFSNTSGAITPLCSGMCSPGKYSDDGYARCVVCGQGKFQTESNSSRCVSCPTKTTTLVEGSTACVCEIGFFNKTRKRKSSGGGAGAAVAEEDCIKCPVGFLCDSAGVVVATADLQPGFWRYICVCVCVLFVCERIQAWSLCLVSCRRCWLCAHDNSAFTLRVATPKHPTCPTANPSLSLLPQSR